MMIIVFVSTHMYMGMKFQWRIQILDEEGAQEPRNLRCHWHRVKTKTKTKRSKNKHTKWQTWKRIFAFVSPLTQCEWILRGYIWRSSFILTYFGDIPRPILCTQGNFHETEKNISLGWGWSAGRRLWVRHWGKDKGTHVRLVTVRVHLGSSAEVHALLYRSVTDRCRVGRASDAH